MSSHHRVTSRAARHLLAALALGLAACGPTGPSGTAPVPGTAPPIVPSVEPAAPTGPGLASSLPGPSGGFGFDPESIVGYYRSIGYQCTERQPSATAAGYQFESCQLVDADGRTLTVGVVTDSADNVADASFSVRATDRDQVLDPAAVLEPFAAFLGAFLGEAKGTELLPWLAGHLGDADARTTLGELTIATYTDTPQDHSKLTLEIANEAYLDAPAPSGAEAP